MNHAAKQPAAQALFAWPPQAAVGRVLHKNKIYDHAKPAAAVRALFVAQVEQITWRHKLAPETVNLAARPGVPEIEVFEITLKTPRLDDAVLRCIDKAIPFPILFELRFDGHTQAVAAYKRHSEADASKWVVSDYFAGAWQADDGPREGLPVSLDLRRLYEQLVRTHLPVPARTGESLRDQVERVALMRSKQTASRKLAARLAQEKQFNRKVELNAQLRTIRSELNNLAS